MSIDLFNQHLVLCALAILGVLAMAKDTLAEFNRWLDRRERRQRREERKAAPRAALKHSKPKPLPTPPHVNGDGHGHGGLSRTIPGRRRLH